MKSFELDFKVVMDQKQPRKAIKLCLLVAPRSFAFQVNGRDPFCPSFFVTLLIAEDARRCVYMSRITTGGGIFVVIRVSGIYRREINFVLFNLFPTDKTELQDAVRLTAPIK